MEDIQNVEAWAVIFEDLLHLIPPELCLKVLELATKRQEVRSKANLLIHSGEFVKQASLAIRHWNAIMRLRSLVVQVFARTITSENSHADAAELLFARHRFGHGSQCLSDYLPQETHEK
jgi:hypothetical protein